MNGSFIDDLKDIPGLNNFDAPTSNPHKAIAKASAAPTFPCEKCGGTGRYKGVRIHQPESRCFACGGKGYFKKSYKDRMEARQKAAARKVAKLDAAKAAFHEAYPGLIEAARALTWNNFVMDVLARFDQYGSLSERQAMAVQNQIDKAKARDEQRAKDRAVRDAASTVDPSNIRGLFDTAKANGLKKPGLWFGSIKISEAPANGVNAGALYVKQNGEYAGKIVDNTFKAAWGVDHAAVLASLLEIASNPAEVLRVKGKETGVCCCCGRTLTDPESIKAGIGPVCASNWGL